MRRRGGPRVVEDVLAMVMSLAMIVALVNDKPGSRHGPARDVLAYIDSVADGGAPLYFTEHIEWAGNAFSRSIRAALDA